MTTVTITRLFPTRRFANSSTLPNRTAGQLQPREGGGVLVGSHNDGGPHHKNNAGSLAARSAGDAFKIKNLNQTKIEN